MIRYLRLRLRSNQTCNLLLPTRRYRKHTLQSTKWSMNCSTQMKISMNLLFKQLNSRLVLFYFTISIRCCQMKIWLALSDDSDNGGSERDTTSDTAKVEWVTDEVTSTKYFQILIQYCPRRVAASKRHLQWMLLLQRKNPFVVRNITVFIYTE